MRRSGQPAWRSMAARESSGTERALAARTNSTRRSASLAIAGPFAALPEGARRACAERATFVIGIAMLAVFAVCAALMAARLLPALLAVPLMALAIAALAGAGPAGLALVVTKGTVALAGVMVTAVFGALLSRVTIQTGIAETI